jgi:hypothetical protein
MSKLIAIFISVAMLTICTVLALYMPPWLLLLLLSLAFLTNMKRGTE